MLIHGRHRNRLMEIRRNDRSSPSGHRAAILSREYQRLPDAIDIQGDADGRSREPGQDRQSGVARRLEYEIVESTIDASGAAKSVKVKRSSLLPVRVGSSHAAEPTCASTARG